MSKRPSFQFYPGDWLNDAALRMVSVGARGLWMDMICIMHQGCPYGWLKVNHKVIHEVNLARMVGATLPEVEGWLKELEDSHVFSRDEQGTIFSRRMVRDEEMRLKRAAGGIYGGNPALKKGDKVNHKVNGKVGDKVNLQPNLPPTPSSSSSSSSSTVDVCVEMKSSRTPPSGNVSSPVLVFPCDGEPNTWELTESQLQQWITLYPALDILAECRKALAWVSSSHHQRKTSRGMPKFLVSWLNRSQDSGGRSRNAPASPQRLLAVTPLPEDDGWDERHGFK